MANKRKSLCIDEKVLLIRAIETGEKISDVGKRFGFSRSTVSTIWKNKEKILQAAGEGKCSKKLKKPIYEDLDQAVLSWFHRQRQNNMPISGPLVKAKAVNFADELGLTSFKASEGWLGKFKQRHHINYGKISGEARSVDTNVTHEGKIMESEECSELILVSNTEPTPSTSSDMFKIDENLQDSLKTADKSVQVYMGNKLRSKATQTQINLADRAESHFKVSQKCVSTSPFRNQCNIQTRPSSSLVNISRKLFLTEEKSDSDIFLYTPSACSGCSPSKLSAQINFTSDCSELIEEQKRHDKAEIVQSTLKKIKNKPRFYIGVPKSCYYIIDLIIKETNIPEDHLLLCLKKIRLDSKYSELADDFAITESYASEIFLRTIPVLVSVLRPFIVQLNSQLIRKKLPISFRQKYYKVSCIIDCLEIEVQKPSNAVNQAMTWSDYKKANTIKYLISCTPNGLVNYISPGFGGRVTNTGLVESCDFLQGLSKGMCVMADRGFKHVEQYINKAGIQLVRPPSIAKGAKFTKSEAKETKQIASLRIHVERVIRRLREFSMLRPHSCINFNLVKVTDDVITIACALINLQDSLIK